MTTARDVAGYYTELAARQPGFGPMTADRLHQLLFLSQGWHLAAFGQPLFPEAVRVGPDGPTVDGVDGLTTDHPGLTWNANRFTRATWEKYRGFAADELREIVATDVRSLAAVAAGGDDVGTATVVPHDRLRQVYADRPELRGFDPQEWYAVGEGEWDYEQGRVVPLSAVLEQLQLQPRCATN